MYIVASILILTLVNVGQSEGQFSLENTSFSIRSTIYRQSDGQKANWIEVEESYSHEQRRARIDYRIKLSEDLNEPQERSKATTKFRGSFIYDSEGETGILTDSVCTRSNRDEIATTLGLYLPKEAGAELDYVVGPARLLLFINKHRNKMALSNMKEPPILVRNMRSLMYNYDYHDDEMGKDVKFNILYSEISRAADKDQSLPIQVVITFDKTTIIVDFWEPELMAPNAPKQLRRFETINEHSLVDLFTYKLAAGCSEALQERSESLFTSPDVESNTIRQFSFRAKIRSYSILDPTGPSGEMFIAYDKSVNSMRVDSLTSGLTSVFSINLNRAYHLRDTQRYSAGLSQNQAGGDLADSTETSAQASECIVSYIYHDLNRYDEKRFTLGKLLLGADDFVYMGKGQVHGVDAVIYEAHDVVLPFWLDREFPYYNKEEFVSRDPMRGLSGVLEQKTLDLVAYFADTGDTDDEHRLLMIDINYFDKGRTTMFGKMTILIDDFVWKIDNQSPTGDKASELFSLADDCSIVGDSNSYSQVNMLLESTEQSNDSDSLLDIVGIRDMALIASLQDRYNLPATMIYDLETRVSKHKDHLSFENRDIRQIHVSFRVAKHTEDLVSLEFTGFGSSSKSLRTTADGMIQVQSFEDCFIEATSRGGSNLGYRHEDNLCLLDAAVLRTLRQATVKGDLGNQVSRILQAKSDTVELYRIVRKKKKDLSNQSGKNCPEIMKQLQMLHLDGVDRARKKVSFLVKAINFNQINRGSLFSNSKMGAENELETEIENARQTGTINGLAIMKDRSSKRIKLSDDSSYPMTEERCHAACLVDINCRIYSICLINYETTCITSGLNITEYAREIIAKKREEDDKDHKIVVKLIIESHDDQEQNQIELTKHPNCKIRIKNYVDLFLAPVDRLQKIDKRRFYAVDDINKCAEMVTMRNIKTLQQDSKQLPDVQSLISASDGDRQSTILEELHKRAMKTLVYGFFYFDKTVYQSTSQNFRNFLTKQINQLDQITDLDSIDGFCIMNGEPSEEEVQAMKIFTDSFDIEKSHMYISYSLYQFKFEIFYEKHHGIRLITDTLTAAEQEALEKFLDGTANNISESDSALVEALLDRGDNIQIAIPTDLENCAELCFSQRKGPWPGCRSFDFVTYNSPSREHILSTCFLNSMTLKQAFANQRYDLVNDRPDDSHIVHYEPRAGFIEDEVELGYDVGLLASFQRINNKIRIQAFGIFCIVLISLIGGVALGLASAVKYVSAKQLRGQQREGSLVPSGAGRIIEFNNQVNSEGEIKGIH